MPKQGLLPGTEPKLNLVQRAALTFVEANREAGTLKERAKKREQDMVAAAHKAGVTTIKVTDNDGWTHVFEVDAVVKVKHTAFQSVVIEKAETN